MILLIDNYDSFVWNLAQLLGGLGAEPHVVRNDQISVGEIEALSPQAIVISPGPGTPEEAGISTEVVAELSGRIPILGVCLGHQAVAVAFGGAVVRAREVMHGKVSSVFHDGEGLLEGLASPFQATRYHSLVVDREKLPDALKITAWTEEGDERVIQGLAHQAHETWGVQFHPESVSTELGSQLMRNLLERVG